MKNELKIVTFTGAELYSLLPNDIQAMYQFNVIEQHGEMHFRHILLKKNWRGMKHFLQGGFLFAEALPSLKFWVDCAEFYNERFEDAAIAEII